jgi:phage host-nuclease inhibitor protein Gam
LYDHQKQLFTLCKQPNPKLILYIAPTGTGKTMSPLGLSEKFKVIFVCAARHVGLALAKAAISMQKKIAFAFGCKDAEDIRLHYYAAKEYTVNQKSGGIGKVDNSQGEKVEIIISDVQSYLPAMLYMLAFNPKEKIILYWDEPTISMDYPEHELHSIIRQNWQENLIPNVVLSSATLPQRHEISETITDFCSRFNDVEVHEIVSYDCKKTIPLINREGFVEMPHYLFPDYAKTKEVVAHCLQYKTLMRYIDLQEAVQFILHVEKKETIMLNDRYRITDHFTDLGSFNMYNIKMFYLNLLGNLQSNAWPALYKSLESCRKKRYESTVNIVTTDAHTLTDGPTIFLAEDVNKIAQFYIQTANIPEHVIKNIMEKIQYNRILNEKISVMEKTFEDGTATPDKGSDKDGASKGKGKGKDKKGQSEDRFSPEMKKLKQDIEEMQIAMKMVVLNPTYVPNTRDHLYKYAAQELSDKKTSNVFTCNVSERVVEQIMQITDIADYWKLLLMMGIGVFAEHKSTRYVEVMKQLAQEHKLYMIIASTDYIYGTNYQLCHGYIGKDLTTMTQEKCIQAMGRVGRNKLQQDYSVRFRDNELLYKLFQHDDNKPEVLNMNRLFNSLN